MSWRSPAQQRARSIVYEEGKRAFLRGEPRNSCPFVTMLSDRAQWQNGWDDAAAAKKRERETANHQEGI